MNCATHNDVAAVAFCRTCGKPLCNQCTRDVRGVIYCESCLAARMEGQASAPGYAPPPAAGFAPVGQPGYGPVGQAVYPPSGSTATPGYRQPANSGPNPTVAGILAGVFPIGVGAVYCSQYAKGLAHLIIFVLLIIGESSDVPWYMHTMLAIGIGFFWIYQIIDAIRTAKAMQMGEPPPDPLGLGQMFGTGEKLEGAKVPTGAAVLIGLGILFMLHTAGLFEIGMGLFISLILIFLGVWLFAKQWGLIGGTLGCRCEHCRTRKLMGPAMLTTIGLLFLLDSTSHIGFDRSWPAILLVIGVVKLMQSNASYSGHVGPMPPIAPSGYPPNVTPPADLQGPPPAPSAPATPAASQPSSSGEVNNV